MNNCAVQINKLLECYEKGLLSFALVKEQIQEVLREAGLAQ